MKNILGIKTMLGIAQNYGNCLKKSWKHFLKCMSKLDDLQTIASGAQRDQKTFSKKTMSKKKLQGISPELQEIEMKNGQIIRDHINSQKIDEIFTKSS